MQRLTRDEVETELTETMEENYGNEGNISALLDRAIRQRRLDEIVSRAPAETD